MQKSGTNLYDKELKKKQIIITDLLSKGGNKPLSRRLVALSKFKKILSNEKFDIAHFNICNSMDMLYAYIAKKSGIKTIIVHSHNSGVSGKTKLIKTFIHKIFKKMLKNVPTSYIACSEEAANWMFTKDKLKNVKIVNNSVDVERYLFDKEKRESIRKELKIDDNSYVVGNIARFCKEKNHVFLIDVFEEICKKDDKTKLLLVGNGELEEHIRDIVKSKKINDKVIFYGVTKNIQGILSAMDCFVLPSIFEGKPVVSIEEQISGLHGVYSNSITKEINLTDLIEYVDLEKGKEYWANEILDKKKYVNSRKSMDNIIEKKGYGLESLKENIERIYGN